MTKSAAQHQRELEALRRVQRRVLSIAFFAVTSHGVFGLIGVAFVLVDQDRRSDALILTVLSGVVALIVCAGTRAILGRRPFSLPWSVASVVPTIAALVYLI